MTTIIKVNLRNPEIPKIKLAAKILREGGVVAFPTETVYGLGANALDEIAVKRIFEAKGRPQDNPLIVHVADRKDVYKLAKKVPREAEKLINKFWPGPLTLILRKSRIIPSVTSGNLDTVAIRMPAHPVALALIKYSQVLIAAPSANISGKPSPTSAKHVIKDLSGKIDMIIDCGKTKIGVESTVLDLTSGIPTILRPGSITIEQLKKILGKVNMHIYDDCKVKPKILKSPGMKYKHYAPNASVILIEGNDKEFEEKIEELIIQYKREEKKIGIITYNKNCRYKNFRIKFIGGTPATIAKNLFKALREFDEEKVDIIIVKDIDDRGLGAAIMNKLRKAAHKIIRKRSFITTKNWNKNKPSVIAN